MSGDLDLLHIVAVLCVALLCLLVLLVCAGTGLAARIWADAIAAAYRAHAHRLQVHVAETNAEVAEEAVAAIRAPRAPYVPPTEDEIRASILAARADREYTTKSNDGEEEGPPIPPGGLYAEMRT